MRALAEFILRSRMTAVLVISAFAVLSLVFPPLGHVSGGALALIVLRRGVQDGFLILVLSVLVLAVLGALSQLDLQLILVFLLVMTVMLWLPVIVAAQALRRTRSLAVALTLIGTLGACALTLEYLIVGDMAAFWRPILKSLFEAALLQPESPVPADEVEMLIASLALAINGLLAAALVVTTMINVIVGRGLQALLYNPGGLRAEFLALRLSRKMAIIALVLLLISSFATGSFGQLVFNMLLMVVAMYALHGLALMHATVDLMGAAKGWLVGLYLLLVFLLPQVMIVLSAAGVADSWIDFRGRLAASRNQ